MRWSESPTAPRVDLKTEQPHSARIYDYLLGGKDNFPADREAAEQVIVGFPQIRTTARQNRYFMARAVRYLAGEAGITQFLDIGTGIPTSPNLHEIAQEIVPAARVVYADNDPIVLVHARALLTSSPAGRTTYLDVDLRDVETILTSAELHDTLDLTRPVALSLIGILHFFPDEVDPYAIVARLLDALPAGSFLALTHGTPDFAPAESEQGAQAYRAHGVAVQLRRREEVARSFDGLDLVDPGLRVVHRWRPDGDVDVDVDVDESLTHTQVGVYGAIGRKS
nr:MULTISPECIES: SAM-dependent methyltransferase [Frankia]